MTIIEIIIAFIVGIGISSAILIPKIQKRQQENDEIKKQEQENRNIIDAQINRQFQLNKDYDEKLKNYNELISAIQTTKKQAEDDANQYYEKEKALAEERYKSKEEQLQSYYQNAKEEYSKEYIAMLKDLTENYTSKVSNINSEIEQNQRLLEATKKQLQNETELVASAVSAKKRTAEMEQKTDFYKLNISDEDKYEMSQLRECLIHFRNPEPINKVIWKVYYEKPTSDLIGRVIGAGQHTGIYKITNLTNGMCYVGQSVDLGQRWRQHIKRGIGADTPTQNKLYPAMWKDGVENFTFEVIQECPQEELNEKEKFWTDYFKAQEYGYSIRKG